MSLNSSSVCVVDESGTIVRETKVASEPVALINWFKSLCTRMERIGLEAGPLSNGLYGALRESGLPVELLETRHVKAALSAMPVKTDRNDARGLAQLMRLGWFRPVHCKSMAAQEVRALLTARKLVQSKLYDIEMSLRGILRGFGLKAGDYKVVHMVPKGEVTTVPKYDEMLAHEDKLSSNNTRPESSVIRTIGE